jgi:hypothetical protein
MKNDNNYQQGFIKFSNKLKEKIPAIYNRIYYFRKEGKRRKKGNAYYGVNSKVLQTPTFFPWGHNKAISKMVNFKNLKDSI